VLEIVSAPDETTEVSVVGKFPDIAVPFAFTVGLDGAVGAFDVDETTDASSVAKPFDGALAAGDGEAATATCDVSGIGDDEGALPFAFAACCSFICCFNSFTVSVSARTCWRNSSTSGEAVGLEAASCARKLITKRIANAKVTKFFM
jgi:hypothetical protein